jgi:hypothetical protein
MKERKKERTREKDERPRVKLFVIADFRVEKAPLVLKLYIKNKMEELFKEPKTTENETYHL